jgi:hypothetical protein
MAVLFNPAKRERPDTGSALRRDSKACGAYTQLVSLSGNGRHRVRNVALEKPASPGAVVELDSVVNFGESDPAFRLFATVCA